MSKLQDYTIHFDDVMRDWLFISAHLNTEDLHLYQYHASHKPENHLGKKDCVQSPVLGMYRLKHVILKESAPG